MFIRKKKNRSGSTSVVVVKKRAGKFTELHTVGVGRTDEDVEELCRQGRMWINNYLGILEIDFDDIERKMAEIDLAEIFFGNVESILLNGAKLIIDKVYDSICI